MTVEEMLREAIETGVRGELQEVEIGLHGGGNFEVAKLVEFEGIQDAVLCNMIVVQEKGLPLRVFQITVKEVGLG